MAERTAQGKRRGVDSLGREAKQTQVFRFGKEMADGWYAKCLSQIISKYRTTVCDFSISKGMTIYSKAAMGSTNGFKRWGLDKCRENESTRNYQNWKEIHCLPQEASQNYWFPEATPKKKEYIGKKMLKNSSTAQNNVQWFQGTGITHISSWRYWQVLQFTELCAIYLYIYIYVFFLIYIFYISIFLRLFNKEQSLSAVRGALWWWLGKQYRATAATGLQQTCTGAERPHNSTSKSLTILT